jgi:hypothetical protein
MSIVKLIVNDVEGVAVEVKDGVQTSGGKVKAPERSEFAQGSREILKWPIVITFANSQTIQPNKITMAKKRKASSAGAAREDVVDDSNKRTKMRIKTYEDVAGSDDEFHINRDKVMLDDGPEAKRRRRVQEEGKDWYLYALKTSDSNPRK